ncbi:8-oxoguanine deaminase [Mycobacterium sp. MS1601]|uniref:8-oxoguanine deaminase n=1 Tax=Mycobacterium sp. MS1601 TaxID=1936029 RepID=UPI00097943C5|nr:8-oxoguanine deaminase [Mycobacterium sp. MS1601]AQA04982.1 8-oxoguanine deaminase [Mycobacterium sp. MS1601]
MPTRVITNCAVATVDNTGTEYRTGHIVVRDGVITAVGEGPAPELPDSELIDGTDCLATPGLVNTHHHLNQWITRGHAQDGTLFQWLTTLYPLWAAVDQDLEFASASAGLGMLALTGCTTSMDHHYIFPKDGGFPTPVGDVLAAEVAAASRIGLRFHPTRGSMDLGASSGGLPPDSVVEDIDTILAACADAVAAHHDPGFDSHCRIALAPCSPFSVTAELMKQSAVLARELGVRMHTHLAETEDEEAFCLANFGARPVDYVESLGWLGSDVWMAHCVHLSEGDIAKFAATGTGVAHCPSSNGRLGSGIAPIPELLAAGVPVGLGVDGVASNEHGGLATELRESLLAARFRLGPLALTARQCLQMGTMGGARCLGRDTELGSLEPGKLADIALWDLSGLGHADIEDPVCALVFGPPAPLRQLLVGGRTIVSDGELRTADPATLATEARSAARRLRQKAGL